VSRQKWQSIRYQSGEIDDVAISGDTFGRVGPASYYPSDTNAEYIALAANHAVAMAQEIMRLRAENEELRNVIAHPPNTEKLIDNLTDSLVSAESEIDKLRAQLKLAEIHRKLAGVTEEEVLEALKPESACDCDGRHRWRCANPPEECLHQEALRGGRWA